MRRQLLVAGLWVGLASIAVCLTGCHGGGTPPVAAPPHADTAQDGLRGDLNRNGTPDVADAIGILRIAVNLDAYDPRADCNGDGDVGVADAILVLRCAVGLDDWPIPGSGDPGYKTTGPDGQTLVWVPSGSFMMGGTVFPHEQPIHEVTIEGFWIGRCEVTNAQYQVFCTATGRTFPPGSNQGDDHPAVDVSWDDAQAYCDHYGYALPTEAQWEYAARGPASSVYPWGDAWDLSKCCNYDNKGPGGRTYPVGSFPTGASWCGALDMAGNVWEWCADWYSATYYQISPDLNPPGPETGASRVVRGGAWNYYYYYCRTASRDAYYPTTTLNYYGFRVSRGPL